MVCPVLHMYRPHRTGVSKQEASRAEPSQQRMLCRVEMMVGGGQGRGRGSGKKGVDEEE